MSIYQKGIRGIVLFLNFKYLYYLLLVGVKLYQIEIFVIRNKDSIVMDINIFVREIGNKDFLILGMYSIKIGFYLIDLSIGFIVKYSYLVIGYLVNGSKMEVMKNCLIQWLDSLIVDVNENFWFILCNVEFFFGNFMMIEYFIFFIWKFNIG